MTNGVQVSIVIPCTDRIAGLKKSIYSCLKQSIKGDLEIIVVENNSKNLRIIPELLSEINDSRIKHYYLDDCNNANCARNYGADVGCGTYIAFLDSDDWWSKSHLEECLNEARKGHKAVYSGFFLDNGFKSKEKYSRQIKNESAYEFLFGKNSSVAQTSSFFIEKNIISSCRWDEDLKRSQDYDYFITVQNKCGWKYKKRTTSYVYWEEGAVRNLSIEAFKLFYNKHSPFMSEKEKAEYLVEVLKAIVTYSKDGYEDFLNLTRMFRKYLSFKDRLFTYNYHVSILLVKVMFFLKRYV